jgi:hypothetical protein
MTLVTAGEVEHDIEIPQEEKQPVGDDVQFVYVGRSFVPGIPARDLTAEEVEAIGYERIKDAICAHSQKHLYQEV